MAGNYVSDRAWSDRFIPPIRSLVGPLLIEPSPLYEDCHEATDLIVLRARDMRIAARVRRPGFLQYGHEFTLRYDRANGVATEMQKVVDGFADWLFYGHAANFEDPTIVRWMVVDLAAWRAHFARDGYRENRLLRWGVRPNGDGTTTFAWFDVRSFPPRPPLLVAASFPLDTGAVA